ncbi:MAG: hypothetical protein AAFU85_19870, partial [Planctomycetota bacterium]
SHACLYQWVAPFEMISMRVYISGWHHLSSPFEMISESTNRRTDDLLIKQDSCESSWTTAPFHDGGPPIDVDDVSNCQAATRFVTDTKHALKGKNDGALDSLDISDSLGLVRLRLRTRTRVQGYFLPIVAGT